MRSPLLFLLALALAGCGLGLSSRGEVEQPAARRPAPPGVDLSKLTEQRQHDEFWEVAGALLAPCPDQAVPLTQCVSEARPCAACTPMTQLVADQVARGAPKANAKAAASLRFGPDSVKDVPVRDSPAKGPADARVTIVAFSDFECPACRAALPLLSAAQAAHPKDVRLVHKFYPLPKHTYAKDAAYAAIAAMRQGKYWAMEELLFDNQDALTPKDLEGYATELGLDLARFRADVAAPETKAMVERDVADAEAAGLKYTPFIFVNGRHFDPTLFRIDKDLDTWIKAELALKSAAR